MNRRHFLKILPALGAVGAGVQVKPDTVSGAGEPLYCWYKYANRPEKCPNDHAWRIVHVNPPGKCVMIVNHDNWAERYEAIRCWHEIKSRHPDATLTIERVKSYGIDYSITPADIARTKELNDKYGWE